MTYNSDMWLRIFSRKSAAEQIDSRKSEVDANVSVHLVTIHGFFISLTGSLHRHDASLLTARTKRNCVCAGIQSFIDSGLSWRGSLLVVCVWPREWITWFSHCISASHAHTKTRACLIKLTAQLNALSAGASSQNAFWPKNGIRMHSALLRGVSKVLGSSDAW